MALYDYSASVAGHEYAQAEEHFFMDGSVQLESYDKIVIEIDCAGWLTCFGTYSPTTIKHIGWFMRERGLTYQNAKRAYLEHKEFNVYTGEYRDLDVEYNPNMP